MRQGIPHSEPEVDVAIFCALFEEADAARQVFLSAGWEVNKKSDSAIERDYFLCRGFDKAGAPMGVYLTWLPAFGPVEMAIHCEKVLTAHPSLRMLLMTGICAGDKNKVNLGDLIIAKGAYAFDAGKARIVAGEYNLQHDPDHKSIPDSTVQRLFAFDSWIATVGNEPRPLSNRHQRDALIQKLLEIHEFHRIPTEWLNLHAPNWHQVLQQMREGPKPLINESNALIDRQTTGTCARELFSYVDPPAPKRYICEVASTAAVREDRPFENLLHPVRRTLAIDMEGHSFYKVAQEHEKPALFVKGVCDYADEEKDDTYHVYAARVSAQYALAYISEFAAKSPSKAATLTRLASPHPSDPTTAPKAADTDVSFWHTVNDRVVDRTDVASLIRGAESRVVITGTSLVYIITQCIAELQRTLSNGVGVMIILPENAPDSYQYYRRYTPYLAQKLTLAHQMYEEFFAKLSVSHKELFAFLTTNILMTHSIGLYDDTFYISEFCIDHPSSHSPSFCLPLGCASHRVMAAELLSLIAEGKSPFGGGELTIERLKEKVKEWSVL